MGEQPVTAGAVIIGDEILSGETKERNLGFLAERLFEMGIRLREVRVVADDEAAIGEAVRTLSERYDHVFTSGGIGPTHDDITCASVAKAFGRRVVRHEEAHERLAAFCEERGLPLNPERAKMSNVPDGATLLANRISVAPGFTLGNVHVMAGIPRIFRSMFDAVAPNLRRGVPLTTRRVDCPVPEGTIAADLAAVQNDFAALAIGSYPWHREGIYGATFVVRGEDEAVVAEASSRLEALVAAATAASSAS